MQPQQQFTGQPNATLLRSRYVNSSVDTMSPGRMIVALYDRLVLDLERAEAAIDARDIETTNDCLTHAQLIIAQLHDSLDVERWPAGRNLAGLYLFVQTELISANVEKDRARVVRCRELIVPLRDAWTEAAGIVPSGNTGVPAGGAG
jgi:flagellar protein FliS